MGTGRTIAFLDIGTNSIRLLVVEVRSNISHRIISQEKEVVRLGEGLFGDQLLKPEAMDRAVAVCRRFFELARTYGAQEIISVATSAAREAKNQAEFLGRLRGEEGIEVDVISGKEEARLIYLGVSSGLHLGDRKALFIDIGGGSTEIIIGNQVRYDYLDSLKMGAIRLTSRHVPDPDSPIPRKVYEEMRKRVRDKVIRTKKRVRKENVDLAIGSSGTIVNLAQIAERLYGRAEEQRHPILRYDHLKEIVQRLISLPIKDRRRLPGINRERADIIIGGAVILETLMEEFGLDRIKVSERGLSEGLLIDRLSSEEGFPGPERISVRERSVLRLGRVCNFDEMHARRVTELALELFDSSRRKKLHDLGRPERELLRYSALLHDIGDFISFKNHHVHSHYIISNADLLGFTEREVRIMANVARYHRKRRPRGDENELAEMDPGSARAVQILALLLRLAENLDRSHAGNVTRVWFKKEEDGGVRLLVEANGDCQLECWAVESNIKAFKKTFGRELKVNLFRSER
jgi:exopolyphosphatase/guanosine-5'-triphosphate,3'-diphosphate pyrophosphatase